MDRHHPCHGSPRASRDSGRGRQRRGTNGPVLALAALPLNVGLSGSQYTDATQPRAELVGRHR